MNASLDFATGPKNTPATAPSMWSRVYERWISNLLAVRGSVVFGNYVAIRYRQGESWATRLFRHDTVHRLHLGSL